MGVLNDIWQTVEDFHNPPPKQDYSPDGVPRERAERDVHDARETGSLLAHLENLSKTDLEEAMRQAREAGDAAPDRSARQGEMAGFITRHLDLLAETNLPEAVKAAETAAYITNGTSVNPDNVKAVTFIVEHLKDLAGATDYETAGKAASTAIWNAPFGDAGENLKERASIFIKDAAVAIAKEDPYNPDALRKAEKVLMEGSLFAKEGSQSERDVNDLMKAVRDRASALSDDGVLKKYGVPPIGAPTGPKM